MWPAAIAAVLSALFVALPANQAAGTRGRSAQETATRVASAQGELKFTRHARAVQPGEIVSLTIATPAPADTLSASAFGRELHPFRLDELTWQVLAGIDLDAKAGTHDVQVRAQIAGRAVDGTYALRVAAKSFPTRRLSVDDRFVEPPQDVVARIQEEAALLASTWTASADERLWTGPFVRPVPDRANSAFGSRSVFNGQPRAPHGGADFLSPAGTPIHAPNGGRVLVARELYFTGNTVVIDHGLGLMSLFAHLSRIDVGPQERVAAGQVIGLVGATGRVTGAHLHWTLRLDGARVDPLSLLAILGEAQGR